MVKENMKAKKKSSLPKGKMIPDNKPENSYEKGADEKWHPKQKGES